MPPSTPWRALILAALVVVGTAHPAHPQHLGKERRQLDSDAIVSISAPSTVSAGATVQVTISYTLAGSRDILVDFVHQGDWSWYGGSRATVSSSGTSTISVTLESTIPATSSYTFSVHIVPVGDSWEQATANTISSDVSVQSTSTSQNPSSSIQNGVNLLPGFYNNGYPDLALSLMTTFGKIKTLRFLVNSDSVSQAASWVSQATAAGYNVILAYNIYADQGSDDPSLLITAANWWVSNYAALTQNGAHTFTINLMNEWGSHFISSSTFASGYNSAISIVRQVYSGAIIIEAPGYGQETQIAAHAVSGSGTTISDRNIIISVHLFPYSWSGYTYTWLQTSDLQSLSNIGVPVIVGEFGFIESQTSGADIYALLSYAVSQGWPRLGWVWNGDGMGSDMLDPSWVNNPTATSFNVKSYFYQVYDYL